MRLTTYTEKQDETQPETINLLETQDKAALPNGMSHTTQLDHNASYAAYDIPAPRDIIPGSKVLCKPIRNFTDAQKAEFWSWVDIRSVEECWLWKGSAGWANPAKTIHYGVWRQFKAHRLAYTFAIGEIPHGMTIDHVKARGCTSTLCCNPTHLEPITQTEQIQRRDEGKPFLCIYGHPKPRGRTAKCKICAVRFARETRQRALAKDPEGVRAKRNANRRRQRAAAKARQSTTTTGGPQ